MDNTEVKVNLASLSDNTLTVLEGNAPEPINLSKVEYQGNIFAVLEYIKRKFDKDDAIIVVSEDEKSVILTVRPNHPHREKVIAQLSFFTPFLAFGIEKGKTFSMQEIKQLIRVNKFYFPDEKQHTELLIGLSKSEIKFNDFIKSEEDTRGNSAYNRTVTLDTNMPEKFTLEMPIFKGMPAKKFQVEIALEKRDKAISLWLESPEALQIIRDTWEEEIEKQIPKFTEAGITVIRR